MKKKNLWFVVGGSIAIPLFLVAAFLLYRGIDEFNKKQRELADARAELDRLYKRKPSFPSKKNIAREKENIAQLIGHFDELNTRLSKSQVLPDEQMTPSQFMSLYFKTKEALTSSADDKNVSLQEEFAFGFGRYSKGTLPMPADVPRLTQQLKIVTDICGILYESGVASVTGIKRQEFEAPLGRRETRAGSGRARERVVSKEEHDPDAGKLKEGELYTSFHFDLQFTSKEDALKKLLNSLANADMFIVVTSLTIDAEDEKLKMHDDHPLLKKLADEGKSLLPTEMPARQSLIVAGRETPFKVGIGIDVYRFGENLTNED